MDGKGKKFSPGDVPAKPGVYVFRDRFGDAIYVGKARDLRRRMSQYFQPSRDTRADPKTRSLIHSIADWECYEARTEAEALLLESRLVKQYAPRYNVLLRDDKRFYLLKLCLGETFPKLCLARLRRADGGAYFGPFPQTGALPKTAAFLTRFFGLRPCNHIDPGEEERKRCMDARVKRCSEPCVGKISPEAYRERVDRLVRALEGDVKPLLAALAEETRAAVARWDFERAATLRDMTRNIDEIFGAKNRVFRSAALRAPSGRPAAEDLAAALGMEAAPERVECFDMSTLGGEASVGVAVVFVGGRPDRKSYRRYRIKRTEGVDDYAMVREVIERHFRRKRDEALPMPDLAVIDGGKGQLSSALTALVALGVPAFPVIGLAKRHEEIFLPGRSEPIVLDAARPAARLVQAIRDEAHRFAIAYNRSLRERRIRQSALDDIPGIGTEKKRAILREFPSVAALRRQTPEGLAAAVSGIGLRTAEKILASLRSHPADDDAPNADEENPEMDRLDK